METRSDRGRQGPARYEITVPIGTRVQVSGISASIRVTGTDGEVEASTVSGAVEVLGASDRITVTTVNGHLHAAKLRGRTKLHSTSTSIEAEDIVGDVSAGTVSGRITLAGVTSSHVTAGTVSGTVTYDGTIDPSGSYEFSTHSGNVHLTVPAGTEADLQLETFSGRISSAFPITLQPGDITSMARHPKKMEFSIGRGGARVNASTFSEHHHRQIRTFEQRGAINATEDFDPGADAGRGPARAVGMLDDARVRTDAVARRQFTR